MKTLDTTPDTPTVATMRRRTGATGKLATVGYLTERLGCSRQTALQLTREAGFPKPIDVLNDATRPMAVWWKKDLDRWVDDNPEPFDVEASERARARWTKETP